MVLFSLTLPLSLAAFVFFIRIVNVHIFDCNGLYKRVLRIVMLIKFSIGIL